METATTVTALGGNRLRCPDVAPGGLGTWIENIDRSSLGCLVDLVYLNLFDDAHHREGIRAVKTDRGLNSSAGEDEGRAGPCEGRDLTFCSWLGAEIAKAEFQVGNSVDYILRFYKVEVDFEVYAEAI